MELGDTTFDMFVFLGNNSSLVVCLVYFCGFDYRFFCSDCLVGILFFRIL